MHIKQARLSPILEHFCVHIISAFIDALLLIYAKKPNIFSR